MVFSSSVPALYLDTPDWQQHSNKQQQQQFLQGNHEINSSNNKTTHRDQRHLLVPNNNPRALVALAGRGGGAPPTSTRPNSMAERARMEKIPPLEAPLKCPRCDSTNTKFCYYNNYNLSQPRHFCKACRRYWTRGGALRNVPVGGGCRKNKRSSANKSSSSSATSASTSMSKAPDLSSAMGGGFMASLQNMAQLGKGLSFGGPNCNNHPLMNNHRNDTNYGSNGIVMNNEDIINEYHQGGRSCFPNLLGGFEMPSSFQNNMDNNNNNEQVGRLEKNANIMMNSTNMSTTQYPNPHMLVMKMEDHHNNRQAALNSDKPAGLFMPSISTHQDHMISPTPNSTTAQLNTAAAATTTTDNNNQFWGSTMWNTSTTTTSHDLL